MKALSKHLFGRLGEQYSTERAFTLAELAVVIAILAIIVAVAVPVMLSQASRAEHAVAVENLTTASRIIENLWFNKLASQSCPIVTGAYRDYDPPPELAGGGGYVPVDAEYMSYREPNIYWADVSVTGGSGGMSPPIASLVDGAYSAAGSGYQIEGIWKNGDLVAYGSDIGDKWELMAGKIGVVENRYFWEDGWQENPDNQYLTLMTLEVRKGLAHYYTLNVGVTVAGGTFQWNDGTGSPGDSIGDELADGNPPPTNPPADPPGGDEPPATTPTDPPPGSEPTTPPGDTPPGSTPVEPPPAGENQVSDLFITPNALNLSSGGVFTVHMVMKAGYDPYQIDASTVRACGAAAKDWSVDPGGVVSMKFYRDDMTNPPEEGREVLFAITGNYLDGSPFLAWGYIKIIDN